MWRRAIIWTALVGIALAAIGSAGWMIYKANRSEIAFKQFASDSAKADDERAYVNKKRRCAPLTPQTRAKCEAEEDYAAHQAEHDDRDLEAQRTTAIWTRYLGIAGIIGTAFGLLGVALVLLTFRAAREANVIARETMQRQLRAYVSVRQVIAPEIGLDNPVVMTVELENTGSTPANNYLSEGVWEVSAVEPSREYFEELYTKYPVPSDMPGSMAFTFAPRQAKPIQRPLNIGREYRTKIISGEMKLFISGKIGYDDVFGERHLTTYFYRYDPKGLPNRMFQCPAGNHIG